MNHEIREAAQPAQPHNLDVQPVSLSEPHPEGTPAEAAHPITDPRSPSAQGRIDVVYERLPVEVVPSIDPPVKRRVGRPKKNPLEENQYPVQEKPKATKTTETPQTPEQTSDTHTDCVQKTTTPTKPKSPEKTYYTRAKRRAMVDTMRAGIKRKVGRPKKHPLQEDQRPVKVQKPKTPEKTYYTRAKKPAMADPATPSFTDAVPPSCKTVTINVTASMTFPLE